MNGFVVAIVFVAGQKRLGRPVRPIDRVAEHRDRVGMAQEVRVLREN